jgi:tRNA G10  N-methylase Trm11
LFWDASLLNIQAEEKIRKCAAGAEGKKRQKERKNRENRERRGLNKCRVSVGHTKNQNERKGKTEIRKEKREVM